MSNFVRQIYKKQNAFSQKTVFLDRDGIIIDRVDYLSKPSQIRITSKLIKGIKKLNVNNAILIVVTNQPVIARGLATIKDVKLINDGLIKMLNKKHAYINAIYFCPHHPEKHHPDIPPKAMKYRIACDCRKPKVAMLKKAVEDFNVNLKKSFIVGDSFRDIKAGKNLGIKTIFVRKDSKEDNVKSDYLVSDFNHAVDIICKQ